MFIDNDTKLQTIKLLSNLPQGNLLNPNQSSIYNEIARTLHDHI